MFCAECGNENKDNAFFCTKCGKTLKSGAGSPTGQSASTSPDSAAVPPPATYVSGSDVPDGIKGWSWGAFFLNWIWAIGNRTWIGLLALIPYVGFVVSIWLGFKGRELAWKNKKWDSVEHFNRVQKKWSQWGVGLVVTCLLTGMLAAIVIPAYQSYVQKAEEMSH